MTSADKDRKCKTDMVACCEEARDPAKVELMCGGCNQWYHEACVGPHDGKYLPLMQNYQLQCQLCSCSTAPLLKKKTATFSQMCITALANLCILHKDSNRISFSVHKDVIPFIESRWEELTTVPKRTKSNWHSTVVKTMVRDNHIFKQTMKNQFELVDSNLLHISPLYEPVGYSTAKTGSGGTSNGTTGTNLANSEKLGKSGKRKGSDNFPNQQTGSKRSKGDSNNSKQSAQGIFPIEYLHNKDDFHYIVAEPDPHAPYRREFDECPQFLVTPGFLFRPILPSQVMLSTNDKAPQLQVHNDNLSVAGHKGYSLCRASHMVSEGRWYYEAKITNLSEGAAARIGWGQIYANLQAPLGYDKFGYSWRSLKGTVFHESRGKHYMDDLTGYSIGDVIGFYIEIPAKQIPTLPQSFKDKALIRYKNLYYYEHKLNKTRQNEQLIGGSKVKFYKNGISPGNAFHDILDGEYYPALSLYKDITVSLNFGPKFECPPNDVSFRPMSDRLLEQVTEQALSDILYFIEYEDEIYRNALTFIIPP